MKYSTVAVLALVAGASSVAAKPPRSRATRIGSGFGKAVDFVGKFAQNVQMGGMGMMYRSLDERDLADIDSQFYTRDYHGDGSLAAREFDDELVTRGRHGKHGKGKGKGKKGRKGRKHGHRKGGKGPAEASAAGPAAAEGDPAAAASAEAAPAEAEAAARSFDDEFEFEAREFDDELVTRGRHGKHGKGKGKGKKGRKGRKHGHRKGGKGSAEASAAGPAAAEGDPAAAASAEAAPAEAEPAARSFDEDDLLVLRDLIEALEVRRPHGFSRGQRLRTSEAPERRSFDEAFLTELD